MKHQIAVKLSMIEENFTSPLPYLLNHLLTDKKKSISQLMYYSRVQYVNQFTYTSTAFRIR